jgi:hypothetical protein
LSSGGPQPPTSPPRASAAEFDDPGQARERTALAWSRSALNMAVSGTLIARASFVAHLDVLGVLSTVTMAGLAALTWRHGRSIYTARGRAAMFPHHQVGTLQLLTSATIAVAVVAIVVTLAI